jgi:hypothetical protein
MKKNCVWGMRGGTDNPWLTVAPVGKGDEGELRMGHKGWHGQTVFVRVMQEGERQVNDLCL